MKRMYVVLGMICLFIFGAGTLLGQQSSSSGGERERFQKRMQLREEMHRRMMDKLFRGSGPGEDLFSDMEKFMDEVMTDSFSGLGTFSGTTSQNFQLKWSESETGRTLTITPSSPSQKLDINVTNGLIEIKGKNETKTPNGISISNFSNSFNVPEDCDPTKVKMDQKDGNIIVFFPYRSEKGVIPEKAPDRTPLPPAATDVQI